MDEGRSRSPISAVRTTAVTITDSDSRSETLTNNPAPKIAKVHMIEQGRKQRIENIVKAKGPDASNLKRKASTESGVNQVSQAADGKM